MLKQWRPVYFYLPMGELFLPHVQGTALLESGIEIPKVFTLQKIGDFACFPQYF